MPTFGYIKGRVLAELKENEDPTLIGNKINDGIESLWESILLINVQSFMQGPVQNVTFNSGDERQTLVTIVDPVTPLVPVAIAVANNLAQPRTRYYAFSLVTESGSETLLSPVAPLVIAVNDQVASIPAPAVPALSPVGAIGWNLYASDNPAGRMALQNSQPIDFGVSWQEDPVAGVIDDPDLPAAPASNTTADNIFYLKFFQVQNQDGTWTTWQGTDIDSLAMQRASRNLPVASTYQSYAWDILNNHQIEIRPKAGMTLNPRYFYVAKPRRLRFDNASVPFQNFAAEEFLINFAKSRTWLDKHEYDAHRIFESLADKKRLQLLQAVGDQQIKRQDRITPYMY